VATASWQQGCLGEGPKDQTGSTAVRLDVIREWIARIAVGPTDTFGDFFRSANGLGGFDLAVDRDRVVPFDYLHNGGLNHLLVIRPGNHIAYVVGRGPGTLDVSSGSWPVVVQVPGGGARRHRVREVDTPGVDDLSGVLADGDCGRYCGASWLRCPRGVAVNPQSMHAAISRSAGRVSRWIRASSVAVVLVLAGSLLQPGMPAWATDTAQDAVAKRGLAVSCLLLGGPSLRRAAEAALLGSDADLQTFVDSGIDAAQAADDRAAAQVLAGTDGPLMRTAALAALARPPSEVRAFVNGGWKASWSADERTRAYRLLEAGGPTMKAAAQAALAGSPEALTEFLATGRDAAAHADDRLSATRMLTGGAGNSGPVLDVAAQQALAGSAQELREFLESGQFVARARDQELASIRSLTEQARQAGAEASQESLAATEASTRAVNAAEEARKAAQTAAAETAAAGTSAAKASAAAGRAADAAEGAADAARDAINAANAAARAARVAADAARRASAAASLTAQAAARAQRAAADARTDAGKAAAARQAAEAARDAAAKLQELEQVKAERDRAAAQAQAAADAARSAGTNAGLAADAADQAGGHAAVSAKQAQRARNAAAQARRAASAAGRAADRAAGFARAAAQAAQEAFGYAEQAADHAEAAAAAADAAAAAAGRADVAAVESAKHAAAAVDAANLAVNAANQAVALEQAARDEDALRLTEATDQGVMAAQDALAAEQAAKAEAGEVAAWNRSLLWDTAEEDRVDAEARGWLTEATAAGASAAVVVDRGRRAALRLVATGGEWTRAAAQEALAGDEAQLRLWLAGGRRFAVGQDDRARVWHLIDTLADGAEKTAAQAALGGDDAAVERFLRTRDYPGKVARDRLAIYQILQAATSSPTLRAAAERALAGTAADAHQFLRTGQYVARAADDRLEVYRVMETGGPEVKAAAQVALAGPDSYLSYFLTASRYQAAQRDVEQATHVSTVRGLIVQAQQYAQTAVQDAAEANRVAAVARNAANEAASWAQQAAASAAQAAQYADQARQSAAEARASADQAAQSAATARNAANAAQNSANQAARSATTATAAAKRASNDAAAASRAKWAAAESAKAAGADAIAAGLAAKEAAEIYASKLAAFEAKQRSTEPGSGAGGNGTAYDTYKEWACLGQITISTECGRVYVDFAQVLVNPVRCASPANAGTPGCRMLDDLQRFIGDNAELMLDMLQAVLMACGLVPGAGEVCDGIDAVVSFGRGDVVGGMLSLGSMIPFLGWGAAAVKGARLADKLRDAERIAELLAKGCKASSFVPGTRVLLADGGTRAIDALRIGDRVLSTDPETNTTAPQPVTDTITSEGSKHLVDITVDVDGAVGAATATVTATHNHPFRVPGLGAWRPADALSPGQRLESTDGFQPEIEAVSGRQETARVYNIGVANFHTYYVLAGSTPLLVHNCSGLQDVWQVSDRVRGAADGHVMRLHGYGTPGVSPDGTLAKFGKDITEEDVINAAMSGVNKNTFGGPGKIPGTHYHLYDTGNDNFGAVNGTPTRWVKIYVDSNGNLGTLFPVLL
jgi:hypothetical protein